MTGEFDPYHKWLGIPQEEQPPNHYRLLAIEPFEDDGDVIEAAADQRMMLLRTHQAGEHVEQSQTLLNEVSAARLCLLNPGKKAEYDRGLRQQFEAAVKPFKPQLANLPPRVDAGEPFGIASQGGAPPRSARNLAVVAGVGAAVTVLIVVLIVWQGGKPNDETPSPTAAALPGNSNGGPTKPFPSHPAVSKTKETSSEEAPTAGTPKPADPNEGESAGKPSEIAFEPDSVAKPPDVTPPESNGNSAASVEQPVQVVPDKPASEVVDERLPVPAEDAQATVLGQIKEIYNLDDKRTDAEQIELARELRVLGRKETTSPTERFVLWRTAMELARDAGDAGLMLQIVDVIGADFDVDVLLVKGTMLSSMADSPTNSAEIESIVAASRLYVDQAVREERYDLALSTAKLAYRICMRPEGRKLRKEAYDHLHQTQELHERHQKLQKALLAIKANPDDGEANLYLGRLYCYEQGDWERGLPYLAKSNDAALAQLAERDLDAPREVADQIELADAWWELARTHQGERREMLLLRAGSWYGKAKVSLSSGLVLAKVEKRLEEIKRTCQPTTVRPLQPGKLFASAVVLLTFEPDTFVQRQGNTWVLDVGAQENHGIVKGATLNKYGKAGTALQLDGSDDWVELPNLRAFLIRQVQALTVCTWFQGSSKDNGHPRFIFDVGFFGGSGVSLSVRPRKSVRFSMPLKVGGADLEFEGLPDSEWHHLAAWWDGSERRIYLDGVMKASSKCERFVLSERTLDAYSARIGSMTKKDGRRKYRFFPGALDEFAVFTRALTEKEIQAIYEMGQQGLSLR